MVYLTETVITALISVGGSVVVALISYAANRKGAREASESNAKLLAYRLEQLEKKQDKHNSVIERMIHLEGRVTEAEHDIRDLKARAS